MPFFELLMRITIPLWQAILLILLLGVVLISLILGLFWYFNNISESKSKEFAFLNRKNIELENELSRSNDTIRGFVNNLSHEISSQLLSINTNLDDMASNNPDETGRWKQLYNTIKEQIKRLNITLRNLRSLSLLETPNAQINFGTINIRLVIEEIIMAQAEFAAIKNVHLSYNCSEQPARILGNRDLIFQMLVNLVDNGIKYSKDEGGNVIIDVNDEYKDLWVRVIDDGIGMDEEDLSHIFETTYRAPSTSLKSGSGLGLALAKLIVEKHGGEIRVNSQKGEGTTFSFKIPLYKPT